MDKKDWTPGELELKEALDKVYENDTRMPSRPLDLSFMDNPPVENKPSKKRTYLLRIAAVVAIILVTSITTAIFVSNDYASAVQDKLQRKVFEMKHGVVVATDEEFAEEDVVVWTIDDLEVAKKAKKIVKELPTPQYIPDGYNFNHLVLHLYDNGDFTASYNYSHNSSILYIACQSNTEDYDSSIINCIKTINLQEQTIIIWQDPISSLIGATVLFNDCLVFITSSSNTLTANEFESISVGLK